jgi:Cyclin
MLLTLAVYLDRMEFPRLNEFNVHRFVLAGLRIAAKYLEDLVWKHDRYSKVVGVSARELSRLELGIYPLVPRRFLLILGFLFLMEFEIVVNNVQLSDMALRLRKGFST